MPRFVVLKHVPSPGGDRPLHWDFMLEDEGRLWTWALSEPPAAGATVAAERLADHRLAYLDYEGEVSGNRGIVTRFDSGQFQWLARTEDRLEIALRGEKLQGRAALVRSADPQRWTLEVEGD
ncbi:MAG: hypothetical protein HYS13_21225 [Planctomycetia bacterium]|nr:hypothetical protein [Planctomycetia bacterium]